MESFSHLSRKLDRTFLAEMHHGLVTVFELPSGRSGSDKRMSRVKAKKISYTHAKKVREFAIEPTHTVANVMMALNLSPESGCAHLFTEGRLWSVYGHFTPVGNEVVRIRRYAHA